MSDTQEKPALVVPQVNLNGTSGLALIEQQAAVMTAINAALTAMAHAAPHGRDYQTMERGSLTDAIKQWEDRRNRLQAIHDEAYQIAMAINAQEVRKRT